MSEPKVQPHPCEFVMINMKLKTIFYLLLIFITLGHVAVAEEACVLMNCGICVFYKLLECLTWFIILISPIITLAYLILYWRERKQEKKTIDRSTIKILLMFFFTVLIPLIILLIPTIFLLMNHQGISTTDILLLPYLLVSYIPLLLLGVLLKFHKRIKNINHIMAIASAIPIIVAVAILVSGMTECACHTYSLCSRGSCGVYEEDLQKMDSALEKGDITVCENLRFCRDICYQEFAEKRKDPLICNKIHIKIIKDECYKDVAIAKKDPVICEKIERSEVKHQCYWHIAAAKQDPSLCEKIKDQDSKEWCYLHVAKAKLDIDICNRISDQDIKDNCYRKVSQSKQT